MEVETCGSRLSHEKKKGPGRGCGCGERGLRWCRSGRRRRRAAGRGCCGPCASCALGSPAPPARALPAPSPSRSCPAAPSR
eukprot:392058-Rhodomonas_salina.2